MRCLRSMLLAATLAAGACISTPCTANLVPGIRVTIVDAATGKAVTGDVVVVATDGSYTEIGSPRRVQPVFLAMERPGTYRVEVQAPGYVPWVKPEVRVTEDECHVRTVDLTAELVRAGGG